MSKEKLLIDKQQAQRISFINSDENIKKLGFNISSKAKQAREDMIKSEKTLLDSMVSNLMLKNEMNFEEFLHSLDKNNICDSSNSKVLVIFMGYLGIAIDEDVNGDGQILFDKLDTYSNKRCTWGELVQFSHKYTSLIGISDDFYNISQDYILSVLK